MLNCKHNIHGYKPNIFCAVIKHRDKMPRILISAKTCKIPHGDFEKFTFTCTAFVIFFSLENISSSIFVIMSVHWRSGLGTVHFEMYISNTLILHVQCFPLDQVLSIHT